MLDAHLLPLSACVRHIELCRTNHFIWAFITFVDKIKTTKRPEWKQIKRHQQQWHTATLTTTTKTCEINDVNTAQYELKWLLLTFFSLSLWIHCRSCYCTPCNLYIVFIALSIIIIIISRCQRLMRVYIGSSFDEFVMCRLLQLHWFYNANDERE